MSEIFSINAYAPVINQSSDSFHERLRTEVERFTSTYDRGFDTARFVIQGDIDYLTDWFVNGLVRDIVWKDQNNNIAWNGYVSRMQFAVGGCVQTVTVDGMANRVVFTYTPLDTSVNPPTEGAETSTTVNNTDSQDRYGIKVGLVNGGRTIATEATDQANGELNELSTILAGERITTSSSRSPTLTIEQRGYSHMADWWNYTQTAVSGTDTANAIVSAVLADDPNSVLSTDATFIETSTADVEKYWDGGNTSWEIIQEIADRGDGYKWVAQIFENRQTVFKPKEALDTNGDERTTNKYLPLERHKADAGFVILDQSGIEIMPWQIRPDRLLYTAGRSRRLAMYIQQVQFATPWNLQLSGLDEANPLRGIV